MEIELLPNESDFSDFTEDIDDFFDGAVTELDFARDQLHLDCAIRWSKTVHHLTESRVTTVNITAKDLQLKDSHHRPTNIHTPDYCNFIITCTSKKRQQLTIEVMLVNIAVIEIKT